MTYRGHRFGFVVGVSLAIAAVGAQADEASHDAEVKAEVARRVDRLSRLLSEESRRGDSLRIRAEDASPAKLSTDVRATASGSAFPLLLERPIDRSVVNGRIGRVTRAQKQAFIDTVAAKTAELKTSSSHLATWGQTIQQAPADQALDLAQAIVVPRDSAIVLATGGLSAATPGAIPLPVSPLPPGSTGLAPFIVGLGFATVDYPATAAILYTDTLSGTTSIQCTGALIAPNVVATAAHCVNAEGATLSGVYFQHGGVHDVVAAIAHPSFAFPRFDIALLTLKDDVTGIVPLALNTRAAVAPGTPAQIVGFGYHSGLGSEAIVRRTGMKFYGNVATSACDAAYQGQGLICWTFEARSGAALSGSTCNGDSGGPLLVVEDGAWRLAGLTSGGGADCTVGDRPVDTEIYAYADWIREQLAAMPASSGAPLEPSLQPATSNVQRFPFGEPARIFAQNATWARAFTVPPGTRVLRVAMNTIETGSTVHFQVGPHDATAACARDVDDVVTACEVQAPAAGAWDVSVAGIPGQEYQLVATAF
ncbi:hypothetical protein FHW12_003961 [Dokdonella fugitiva]|uniref:Peptidase S1 domain-containing protein n=1 Tax=Dokdonella fugitiva TaxID=328517 RepID=A0A839FCC0_9GAMM|nr:trypsin-like serine protease [Dokdonella fugitiva]MBA8889714.1 hypothetical protein [Dokdonella fugitiva]